MQLSTDFTQRGAYLQIFFYSKTLFSEKLLQRDRFTQTQSSFYAQHFLRRDPVTNRLTSFYHTALRYFTHTQRGICTAETLAHIEAFTQSNFYMRPFCNSEIFTQRFFHRDFYVSHRAPRTQRPILWCMQRPILHRDPFLQRPFK